MIDSVFRFGRGIAGPLSPRPKSLENYNMVSTGSRKSKVTPCECISHFQDFPLHRTSPFQHHVF